MHKVTLYTYKEMNKEQTAYITKGGFKAGEHPIIKGDNGKFIRFEKVAFMEIESYIFSGLYFEKSLNFSDEEYKKRIEKMIDDELKKNPSYTRIIILDKMKTLLREADMLQDLVDDATIFQYTVESVQDAVDYAIDNIDELNENIKELYVEDK